MTIEFCHSSYVRSPCVYLQTILDINTIVCGFVLKNSDRKL